MQPNLAASTNASKVGFSANGNGVLTIQPKNSSESGSNATLGKFVSGYKGLQLSSSTLQYPGKQVWTNGDVCPKGTPDAGKPGVVIVDSWPNFNAKTGSETSGAPEDLLFKNGQLITMAFVPATSTVPKPPAQAITGSDPGALGDHHQHDAAYHRHHGTGHRHHHRTAHPDHNRTHDDDVEAQRNHQVRAVVLVGGEGTRLRPLTLTTPKQMLPIVEQAMIERVIGHLAQHGIDDAVLSLGYRPDAFINAYPSGAIAGVHLTYAVEPTPLDTAGAIRFAAGHAGIDEYLRGGQRGRADRRRHLGPHRLPPRRRSRGNHQPDPGGGPQRLRRGADRRRGPGRGVHREASPGRGADQLHQRRHLRVRDLGAGPNPPRSPRVHRA